MNRLFFTIILLFFSGILFAQESNYFSADNVSMGEINHRDTSTVVVTYTNNSDIAKVLLDTKTNCECTWIEYPKSPILPGDSVELTLFYHAKGRGVFFKTIDIFISDGERKRITVVGSVVDKKQ